LDGVLVVDLSAGEVEDLTSIETELFFAGHHTGRGWEPGGSDGISPPGSAQLTHSVRPDLLLGGELVEQMVGERYISEWHSTAFSYSEAE
jgi:hypothetical protein